MVSPEKYGEFVFGKDFTKDPSNKIKGYLLLSQREFQVSHIMDE
jgi:hypothetical protein